MILYSTGTVFFYCSYHLLKIRLKRQNLLLSRAQEREKVHFVITLFDVGNVLVCIIYQLNFTVFMYVPRISRITLYIAFGIIHSFT